MCTGREIDTAADFAHYTDCEIVDGNLRVFPFGSGDFTALAAAFSSLVAVTGSVSFHDTGIAGIGANIFPLLQAIGKDLSFTQNAQLASIKGFGALHSVGGDLTVSSPSKALTLSVVFLALEQVRGGLSLEDFTAPKGDNWLAAPRLAHMGAFRAYGLGRDPDSSTGLDFPALLTVRGRFFAGNSHISTLTMPKLVTVGEFGLGSIYAGQNHGLKTFDLPSLESVRGEFVVDGVQALQSLAGFGKLTTVGGDMKIAGCQKLQSLAGFGALASVGRLQVSNNAVLGCIKGLSRVARIGRQLDIYNNPKIVICESLYAQLAAAAGGRVSGINKYTGRDSCDRPCE